jgi:hypothetical protein
MTDASPPKAPKAAASKAPASKAASASKASTSSKAPAPATPPVPPAPPVAAPTPPPAPQPYAPQPYGSPGYPQQYGPRTNALAIVSLVSSLVGLVVWFLAPLAGIITGHIALGQIKRTGEAGQGMAMAGLIIGYVLMGLSVLLVIGYIIVIVIAVSATTLTGAV